MFSQRNIVPLNDCLACGNDRLLPTLDLGKQPLANSFKETKDEIQEEFPLAINRCSDCYHVQLTHAVNPELMFKNYLYVSGTSFTMKEHFKWFAFYALETFSLLNHGKKAATVFDIGCNDGSQLDYFLKFTETYGVDPAENLYPISSKNHTVWNDFFGIDFVQKCDGKRFDILVAQNVFAHNTSPKRFLDAARNIMHDDSILLIQTSQADMILNNEFDTCFVPGTYISGSQKMIEEHQVGDIVLDHEGKQTKVTYVFEREVDEIVYDIKVKYQPTITSTKEHPWLIFKNNKREFIKTSDLKVGDLVCVPKKCHENKQIKQIDLSGYINKKRGYNGNALETIILDEDFAYFVGMYVADGYSGGKNKKSGTQGICFAIGKHEKETIGSKLESIVNKWGYKLWYNDRLKYGSNCWVLSLTCTSLSKFLMETVGTGAKNKQIPDFIRSAPNNIKIEFIRGLIDGDGYLKNGQVHLHTSSIILAHQTQELCLELGIVLGWSQSPGTTKECGYIDRNGKPRHIKSGESYQLRGRSSKIREIFDLPTQTKNNKSYREDEEYFYFPIKNIVERDYKGKVYNLETQSHTYTVNNMAVHNCYHEHLSYFNINSMNELCKRSGFYLVDVVKCPLHGNSFIFVLSKDSRKERPAHIKNLIDMERKSGLYSEQTYIDYKISCEDIRHKLLAYYKHWSSDSYKFIGYGAAAKGMTLLNYTGLKLDFIIDDNPLKQGKFAPGSNIPIVGIEKLDELDSEKKIAFVPLAWNFFDEIKARILLRRNKKLDIFIRYFPDVRID